MTTTTGFSQKHVKLGSKNPEWQGAPGKSKLTLKKLPMSRIKQEGVRHLLGWCPAGRVQCSWTLGVCLRINGRKRASKASQVPFTGKHTHTHKPATNHLQLRTSCVPQSRGYT